MKNLGRLRFFLFYSATHSGRVATKEEEADVLYILRQESQEQQQTLELQTNQAREAISKEMAQTRKLWEREQQEFERKIETESWKES